MEKIKKNLDIVLGGSFLVFFIVFTIVVKYVGVLAVGPLGSSVGFGKFNHSFHELFGVNMTLYYITDWLGVMAIAMMLGFAIIGIVQWIKRKKFCEVDSEILSLGIFYIILFAVYALFEFFMINKRPVLIDGILETSYPSSTTLLSLTVCLTAIYPLNKLIKNQTAKTTVKIILWSLAIFMTGARILSGVHWITDIIGGVILSTALIFIYKFILRLITSNKKNK